MNSRNLVLLTGATGFIGSHLAKALLDANYEVVALKRTSSSLVRVAAYAARIQWINTDIQGWEEQIAKLAPSYLVHSAWMGVGAAQRDDWFAQLENLNFTLRLVELVSKGSARKIIVLGSQAEYGQFDGRIKEDFPTNPTTAYGAVKLATLQLVRTYCQMHGIDWYWLRVFAVFGPGEDKSWFVSYVLNGLQTEESIELTACEQQYDYLYVRDLANAVLPVLEAPGYTSGMYNVSANKAVSLRTIVEVAQRLTGSATRVEFGALPYRNGQIMHIEGNSDYYEQTFGPLKLTALTTALAETLASIEQKA